MAWFDTYPCILEIERCLHVPLLVERLRWVLLEILVPLSLIVQVHLSADWLISPLMTTLVCPPLINIRSVFNHILVLCGLQYKLISYLGSEVATAHPTKRSLGSHLLHPSDQNLLILTTSWPLEIINDLLIVLITIRLIDYQNNHLLQPCWKSMFLDHHLILIVMLLICFMV